MNWKKWQSTFILVWVLFLFSAALGLRIAYIKNTRVAVPVMHDAVDYVNYAKNLVEHGVYSRSKVQSPPPDKCRWPGYPLFLAFNIKVFGINHFLSGATILQVILCALLVPLTYLTARFLLPVWAASIAAVLVCFSPHLVAISNNILTETLFSFWLLTSICFFFYANMKNSPAFYVSAGVSFGIAYLIVPTVFFVPFLFIIVTSLCAKESRGMVVRNAVVFLLSFLIIWGGYSIRNSISVKPENITESRMMISISQGSYPDFIYKNKAFQYFMHREDPEQPEYGKSFSNFWKIFKVRVKENPVGYAKWYFGKKTYMFWSWNMLQGQNVYVYPVLYSLYTSSPAAALSLDLMRWCHPLILLLMLLGGIVHLSRIVKDRSFTNISIYSLLIFILLFYYSSIFAVLAPFSRYSVPLRPALYIGALFTINFFIVLFFRQTQHQQGDS